MPIPHIDSLIPATGRIGDVIMVNGEYFSTNNLNYIRFGKGLLGPFNSRTGSDLRITIPDKALGGCKAPSFQMVHCLALISQITEPGSYPVSVITPSGQSNVVNLVVK